MSDAVQQQIGDQGSKREWAARRLALLFVLVTALAAILPNRERNLLFFGGERPAGLLASPLDQSIFSAPFRRTGPLDRYFGAGGPLGDRPNRSRLADIGQPDVPGAEAAGVGPQIFPLGSTTPPAGQELASLSNIPGIGASSGGATGSSGGTSSGGLGPFPGSSGIGSSGGCCIVSTSSGGGSSGGTIDPPPAVPEPGTWGMMIVGFPGFGAVLRRRAAIRGFAGGRRQA